MCHQGSKYTRPRRPFDMQAPQSSWRNLPKQINHSEGGRGRENRPPEENGAPISEKLFLVKFSKIVCEEPMEVTQGHVEGAVGTKVVHSNSLPATPPSPDAKRIDVPRAPSWAYALHSPCATGSVMSSSSAPYEVVRTVGREGSLMSALI